MQTIFVQIASYRDEELPRTIQSALRQAAYPERLRFGICWQYDETTYTDLDPHVLDGRFRISPFHYEESRGCCWARNQTNLLYGGEDFTLQVDAHTRFASDWDSQYIQMLESLPGEKPVLSTYPSPFLYRYGREKRLSNGVQRLTLSRMARDLTTVFKAEPVEDDSKPAPSDFLGAGQIFTLGRFCREVEYDPCMYFAGEEISLSVRAYTHGYDFFCPNRDLVWHLYQHHMPTHWSDHSANQHADAVDRLRVLLTGDHRSLGRHGLGSRRTLEEFEEKTGIDFASRLNSEVNLFHFQRTIRFDASRIPRRSDYHMWILTLIDAAGNEVHRHDIVDPSILRMIDCELDVDEYLEAEPVGYAVWPKTWDEGHLERIFFDL